jgi:CheY-like chemotaxis protein
MRRRILLADDSVTIQKVIELTFLDEDYEVKAVSNGDAAVAALAELRPDFVIADVHMPGANGYEVCRRAKQLHPGVPVLLLVGTFEPFDEGQMRQVGADSYLKKPFDSQELLERVEALLGVPTAAPSPPPEFTAYPAPPAYTAVPSAPPPPAPFVVPPPEPELPSFELPPVAGFPAPAAAAPAALSEFSEFSLEPMPGTPADSQPAPFSAEPLWGFEPAPAPPPEPFDREPTFELGPPPAFAVREEEAIFTFDDTASQPLQLAPEPAWTAGEGAEASTELPPLDESLTWSPEPTPEVRFEPEPAPTAAWSIPKLPATPATPATPAITVPPPSAEPAPAWPAPPVVTAPPPATPATPEITAPAPAATNGGGRLSEEDVDRIAHRLVQLLGDKAIRDIAWEVVPDLAEVIIRDRLRELEGQAELL